MSHEVEDETISGSLLFLHRDEFDAVLACSGVHGVSLRLAMKKIRGKKGLFASITTMAKEAGIGPTKVKDIIGKWVDAGLLSISERKGRSNVYTLLKVPDTQPSDDQGVDATRLGGSRATATTQSPGGYDSPSEVLPQDLEPQELNAQSDDDLETKKAEEEEAKELNARFRDMAKQTLVKGYVKAVEYQLIQRFWKELPLPEMRCAVRGYERYLAWWEAWVVFGKPPSGRFIEAQWFLKNKNWRDELRFPGQRMDTPPSATQKKRPPQTPEERARVAAAMREEA